MRLPARRTWLAALAAVTTALMMALLVIAAPGPARAAGAGFVQRCGTHFCVDGKTAYFAGANSYDLFTFGSGSGDTETQYMDKSAIDSEMADMAADGVTVVRTWMFDHESWHGFEPAKNTMNEQQWAEFDYILFSAAQHGLRVVPALENYWTAYGGVNAVLGWEGVPTANPGYFFDSAKCPGCLADYEFYVDYALNRVNHYTGVAYKNDPTIFSWELMNEPRYQDVNPADNTVGATFRAWEDKVGAYIKNIDPDHMVDNGIEGQGSAYGYGSDNGVPYTYECQSPYIDFCSAHIYPTEGWANLSVSATQALVARYITDAHTGAGKPFFLGEFNTSVSTRSTYWPAIYSTMEAGNGDADAFWWYMNTSKDGNYGVMHGDAALTYFTAHSHVNKSKSGDTAPPTNPPTTPVTTPPTTPVTTPPTTPPTTSPTGTCKVAYVINDWGSAFNADVTITNGGAALNGWSLVFGFPAGQRITNIWNAVQTQNGKQVTAANAPYNGSVPAGGTVNFGFSATSTAGTNAVPAAFTLNGKACTVA